MFSPNFKPSANIATELAIVHAYIEVCNLLEECTSDRCDAVAAPDLSDSHRTAVSLGYSIVADALRAERDSLSSLVDWDLYYAESTRIFGKEV